MKNDYPIFIKYTVSTLGQALLGLAGLIFIPFESLVNKVLLLAEQSPLHVIVILFDLQIHIPGILEANLTRI